VVEDNGHEVADFCATALRQLQISQPHLDLDCPDIAQPVLAPFGENPSSKVHPIALLRGVAPPRISRPEFALFKMTAQLRKRHRVFDALAIRRIHSGKKLRHRASCDICIGVLFNVSDDSFSIDPPAIPVLL
jgi:hypothetical protein